MRHAVIALTLVTLAAGTAAAASQDDADEVSPFVSKSTAIHFVSGLVTPVGFFGFEAQQNIVSFWSVSAGAGFGWDGPQVGAMTHLLLGGARSKLTIGAGWSRGHYVYQSLDGDELAWQKSGTVGWANVEIGGEHRWRSGFSMRYFGGYRRVIQGQLVCDAAGNAACPASSDGAGTHGTYGGFALGFAF